MVSMLLHSCAWIGLLTSIVRTYLCQNAPGEIWITKPYERYKQRSETPGERPKLLAYESSEPAHSVAECRRRPGPAKHQLITHAFLFLCVFALGLFDLLTCLRVCIMGVSYLTWLVSTNSQLWVNTSHSQWCWIVALKMYLESGLRDLSKSGLRIKNGYSLYIMLYPPQSHPKYGFRLLVL